MNKSSIRFKYNLQQLLLPSIILVPLLFYDTFFLMDVNSGREWREYINDIRKINDYCNYYLVFISVIVGFLLTLPHSKKPKREDLIPIAPFGVSLIAASINMVFLPVPYSNEIIWPVQVLWFYHVICEQATVVFAAFGLLGLLRTFMEQRPVPDSLGKE